MFENPECNVKEINSYVAYVVLDNECTMRFPLPKYPSFMFAQVGKMVEYDGNTWRVVLKKSDKKEEIRVI